ncbi:MAG: RNA polymerase sigma factor [Acidobacteria bacterium]|nr:RNA polymerase sigma factor [Acidobacteriota bacterium]
MKEKHSTTGELCFEHELLRTMQDASSLRQKVAAAFELLRDPVHRYLYRVLGDAEEAEDLTQEAFLRLYSSLQKGQAVGNVRAWLFQVAHNLAFDQQKNKSREPWDSEALEQHQDPAPDAEQRVMEQEKRARLQSALDRLSPQEKECLELRAEGLSYREIAGIMGMRLPTLVSFLGRVTKKIMRETYD